ncbi:hypothetical protein AAC387_Pa02g1462 [Persea americana]
MINLPSYSPNSSFSPIRFQISKLPISDFPPKLHFPIPNSSPLLKSLFPSLLPLSHHPRTRFPPHPHRKRAVFRPSAIFGGMESLPPVLEASVVLAAIIIVHESGHFLAAHLQEYSIRAFPLGGFVGFPDNDPDSEIPVDDVNLLKNRPIFDRVLVISAGVVANVVFAYLIIFAQVASSGLPVQEAFPGVLVPEVRELSAAARAGVRSGDVILGVDGVLLPKTGPSTVSQLVDVIKKNPGRNVSLRIGRGDQDLEIDVMPDESSDRTGRIGVQLSPNFKITKVRPKNPGEAFSYTWREFWGLTSSVVDSLRQTFQNFSQSASKVSGPVAIIAVGAEVARSSTDGLYQFAAVLNINLAVINVLPLPALDGGSLALLLIEAARGGKKIPQELEQRIMSSGIMVVVLLECSSDMSDGWNDEMIFSSLPRSAL